MHRRVTSVEWARECERPACIPRARPRGSAAKGLSYERALARALLARVPVRHGQWFSYRADNVCGYCQPDFIWRGEHAVYVFECKLTHIERATEQLLDLYFPVLREAYKMSVRGIIVARSLHRCPALAFTTTSVDEAVAMSAGRVPVLHWLGHGPL